MLLICRTVRNIIDMDFYGNKILLLSIISHQGLSLQVQCNHGMKYLNCVFQLTHISRRLNRLLKEIITISISNCPSLVLCIKAKIFSKYKHFYYFNILFYFYKSSRKLLNKIFLLNYH